MKYLLVGLLVCVMVVSMGMCGMADEDNAVQRDQVSQTFQRFNEKVHARIHELATECMSDVGKISESAKVQWCRGVIQKRIDQAKEQKERMSTSMMRMGREMSATIMGHMDQEVQSATDELDRCQYVANELLIERCINLERNVSRDLQNDNFDSQLLRGF